MKSRFAENLSAIRRAWGFTQSEMSEKLGISRSAYACYEIGKRSPDLDMLYKISIVLHVSLNELMGQEDLEMPSVIREARAVYKVQPMEFSLEEYLQLPDFGDYELVEGKLVRRNAASDTHQELSLQLSMELFAFIKKKKGKCKVIPAPFCVVLSEADGIVLQPDISVICDLNLLRGGMCYGAPDLIMEIVSPGNASYDYFEKTRLYHKYGVKEYWIVNPETQQITIYNMQEGALAPVTKTFSQKVSSVALKGFTINIGRLLQEYNARYESE